jgi:hypothetical protein
MYLPWTCLIFPYAFSPEVLPQEWIINEVRPRHAQTTAAVQLYPKPDYTGRFVQTPQYHIPLHSREVAWDYTDEGNSCIYEHSSCSQGTQHQQRNRSRTNKQYPEAATRHHTFPTRHLHLYCYRNIPRIFGMYICIEIPTRYQWNIFVRICRHPWIRNVSKTIALLARHSKEAKGLSGRASSMFTLSTEPVAENRTWDTDWQNAWSLPVLMSLQDKPRSNSGISVEGQKQQMSSPTWISISYAEVSLFGFFPQTRRI